MLEFEVIDGHISIYEMITQHGFSSPGKIWKQLLQQHKELLPPFTMKQFTMRDGRRGRLRPALQLMQQTSFQNLLYQLYPQDSRLSVQEKAFLALLEEGFPDFEPRRQVDLEGNTLHLFFEGPQVGVVLQSHCQDAAASLPGLDGVQVLVFDPNAQAFSAGGAVCQIRQAARDLWRPVQAE